MRDPDILLRILGRYSFHEIETVRGIKGLKFIILTVSS